MPSSLNSTSTGSAVLGRRLDNEAQGGASAAAVLLARLAFLTDLFLWPGGFAPAGARAALAELLCAADNTALDCGLAPWECGELEPVRLSGSVLLERARLLVSWAEHLLVLPWLSSALDALVAARAKETAFLGDHLPLRDAPDARRCAVLVFLLLDLPLAQPLGPAARLGCRTAMMRVAMAELGLRITPVDVSRALAVRSWVLPQPTHALSPCPPATTTPPPSRAALSAK